AGTVAEASLFATMSGTLFDLAKVGILAITTLVLALMVVRPLTQTAALPAPRDMLALPDSGGASGFQIGQSNFSQPEALAAPPPPPAQGFDLPSSAGTVDFSNFLGGGSPAATEYENPADRLRVLVEQRRDETIALLRSWTEPESVENS
ncbi:MAG: hypothetical protein ABI459_10820, partial [Deltaproteobacteria bacterium]